MLADLDSFYDQRGSLGNADDVAAFKQQIANYDPNDYVYSDYGKFADEYGKTVNDFVNPYYDQQSRNLLFWIIIPCLVCCIHILRLVLVLAEELAQR